MYQICWVLLLRKCRLCWHSTYSVSSRNKRLACNGKKYYRTRDVKFYIAFYLTPSERQMPFSGEKSFLSLSVQAHHGLWISSLLNCNWFCIVWELQLSKYKPKCMMFTDFSFLAVISHMFEPDLPHSLNISLLNLTAYQLGGMWDTLPSHWCASLTSERGLRRENVKLYFNLL